MILVGYQDLHLALLLHRIKFIMSILEQMFKQKRFKILETRLTLKDMLFIFSATSLLLVVVFVVQ